MKKLIIRSLILAAMSSLCVPEVQAQGFFSKLAKGIEKGVNALDSGTKKIEKVSSSLTGSDQQQTDAQANTNTANPASADTTGTSLSKEELLNPPVFTVKKVIQLDEKGDTLRNDDGTVISYYLVLDKDNKVCDPNTAKKLIDSRTKAYGNIIAKTVGGGVLGGIGGALLSKKKSAKDILLGAGAGVIAGLALSSKDIEKVKELNTTLKEYRKTIEVYQRTFTEEGIPVDASIDLTDVEGIDFTKSGELSKEASEVLAELAASKAEGASLEDIDID